MKYINEAKFLELVNDFPFVEEGKQLNDFFFFRVGS